MVGSAAVVVANFRCECFFANTDDATLDPLTTTCSQNCRCWHLATANGTREKSHGLRLESDRMARWYLKNGRRLELWYLAPGRERRVGSSSLTVRLNLGDGVIGRSVIFPKGEEFGKEKQDILFSKTRGFGVLPTLSLRDLVGFCASWRTEMRFETML